MKQSKGFTLIELLAVIVILAVIALISMPIILNIIDKVQEGAFKSTAYGIVQAGEFEYTNNIIRTGKIGSVVYRYNDGVERSSPIGRKLEYKGNPPKSGDVVINSDGKISMAIYNGYYCAEKTYDNAEISISPKSASQCKLDYNADESKATDPELSANMIPIKWDGNRWVKADLNNLADSAQWYNYKEQMWANAVLVTETSRDYYLNASVETAVDESDILAYLVWIPRYKYKLFNAPSISSSVQKIDIVFENKNTVKSLGTTNDSYLTHPSFTFASEELNGFWIGKFETTGSATVPTIKPNVRSLINQHINNQFLTAQLFNNNTYGLTIANDAHMNKNMEWGAVAYLSQSDYGKYGNSIYTGAVGLEKEIYINNINTDLGTGNNATITGCAASSLNAGMVRSSVCSASNQYYMPQGVKASTTGNVYGVYDMVGGTWERTTGIISDVVQDTVDDYIVSNYLDLYANGTTENDQLAYNRRILGDATGEVWGWDGDYANFIVEANPLFRRGGSYANGSSAGIFGFYNGSPSPSTAYSFRVVLLGK